MKFTKQDIADYYNQTYHQYQRWWNLDKDLSVHYGMWDKNTKNFSQALENTNRIMAEIARINEGDRILDAGCGVGGSSIYLAQKYNARVTGITLSEKQLMAAENNSERLNLSELTDFKLEDYSNTSFPDNHFDVIWAIESITSEADKNNFAKEAARLLKKDGVLIIADYFKSSSAKADNKNYLQKFSDLWSMAPIESLEEYSPKFESKGLELIVDQDFTQAILPTAKRMFYSYVFGALPAVLYNMLHPGIGKFGKSNYKSGLYQYKSLKRGLWKYRILKFKKND